MNRIYTVAHFLPVEKFEDFFTSQWLESIFSFPIAKYISDNKKELSNDNNTFNLILFNFPSAQSLSDQIFQFVYDENHQIKGLMFTNCFEDHSKNINEPLSFIENGLQWSYASKPLYQPIYPVSGYVKYSADTKSYKTVQSMTSEGMKLLQNKFNKEPFGQKDINNLCQNFNFYPNCEDNIFYILNIMKICKPHINLQNYFTYWTPYLIHGFID